MGMLSLSTILIAFNLAMARNYIIYALNLASVFTLVSVVLEFELNIAVSTYTDGVDAFVGFTSGITSYGIISYNQTN